MAGGQLRHRNLTEVRNLTETKDTDGIIICTFVRTFIFFKDVIYLFARERERVGERVRAQAGRGAGRGRSRLLTEQGVRYRT